MYEIHLFQLDFYFFFFVVEDINYLHMNERLHNIPQTK